MKRAVIDVGSGSVVLLVAEELEGEWTPIFESSNMSYLGEGVKQTGTLREDRIVDTLAAIKAATVAAQDHGATQVDAVGTMALRLATNAAEFQARAEAQGTPVQIISGEEEAELGFLAVTEDPIFANHESLSILDPGGQSTELTIAYRNETGWHRRFQHSYPLGTLQLRGSILQRETPEISEILAATVQIDDTIGVEIAPADPGPVVALGAPGTDLVMVRNRWTEWDASRVHGAYVDYEEVGKAVGWFVRMTDAERQAVPGVDPGRGRTIHAGCLILERFLNALAAPGVWVSVRGWRHAWIAHRM